MKKSARSMSKIMGTPLPHQHEVRRTHTTISHQPNPNKSLTNLESTNCPLLSRGLQSKLTDAKFALPNCQTAHVKDQWETPAKPTWNKKNPTTTSHKPNPNKCPDQPRLDKVPYFCHNDDDTSYPMQNRPLHGQNAHVKDHVDTPATPT